VNSLPQPTVIAATMDAKTVIRVGLEKAVLTVRLPRLADEATLGEDEISVVQTSRANGDAGRGFAMRRATQRAFAP
jgi:hypothetical protein